MVDPGPVDDQQQRPRRQRVGAYAVLLRDEKILLTRMSERTRIAGFWTLPGGGIDHGEDPRVAAVREVHEETGFHITVEHVVDVHSLHFVGARDDGLVEDYHGLHVIFAGAITPASADSEPQVIEEDSSTAGSAWFSLEEARQLPLLQVASRALDLLQGSATPRS